MPTAPLSITVDGRAYPLEVLRIRGARSYRLRWLAISGSVRLTVPMRSPLKEGIAFAQSRERWLAARIAQEGVRVTLEDGASIPYLGQAHVLRHVPGRGVITRENGEIRIPGEADFLSRRVIDWLKAEARAHIAARVEQHAATLGVKVRRISLKDTTSRWGSCASGGVLSFSWRLVLAPAEVLDYVVAHEVAHLVEMNHSPRFWRVVRELAPAYEAPKRWLKQHGHRLYTAA